MSEEVLPPWASLATWVGLVVAVVISLFKRWLVPKSHHAEVVRQWEARLNDRDELIRELRAANIALDARNDMLSDQIRELVGLGHSTAEVVKATVAGTNGGGLATGHSPGKDSQDGSGTKTGFNKVSGRRGGRRQ